MTTANRIRVLIAGNVYVKRALVRRFLEDDGYEVVGDVMAAEAVVPAIVAGRPDAIVLDQDLTAQGAGVSAIRSAAPDIRVIVFTATAAEAGALPAGADGYLDKGAGLSALTALLGRLFAEPTASFEPLLEGAGVGAMAVASDTSEGSMDDTQQIEPRPVGSSAGGPGRNLYRTVAMVAGALLIVWGVVTAIANEVGDDTKTVAEESAAVDTGGDVIAEPETTSALDEAYATLDRLVEALRGGNYILASVEAQTLMDQREQATAAGFATAGLDAEVTPRLEALVQELPFRVNSQLANILGGLYPAFAQPTERDGGSDVVLGTTVTNDGGTSGGSDTGTDTGTDTGGGGGGGGQTEPAPQPGDGKAWGHSHKPPQGGWHGNKPK